MTSQIFSNEILIHIISFIPDCDRKGILNCRLTNKKFLAISKKVHKKAKQLWNRTKREDRIIDIWTRYEQHRVRRQRVRDILERRGTSEENIQFVLDVKKRRRKYEKENAPPDAVTLIKISKKTQCLLNEA